MLAIPVGIHKDTESYNAQKFFLDVMFSSYNGLLCGQVNFLHLSVSLVVTAVRLTEVLVADAGLQKVFRKENLVD